MPKTLVLQDRRPIAKLSDSDRSDLLDDILLRYSNGQEITQIAPDYCVSEQMLYRYLLAEKSEEFKQAQVSKAMLAFEQAAQERDKWAKELETAEGQVEINRCAQLMKAAESKERRTQWLLERCLSRIYGQEKANSQAPVAIQINLNRTEQEREIAATHD